MSLPDAIQLTPEQVSQDVRRAASKQFNMTVPEFVRAVDNGKLPSSDYAVRELLAWISGLPTTDAAFSEVNNQCLTSTK